MPDTNGILATAPAQGTLPAVDTKPTGAPAPVAAADKATEQQKPTTEQKPVTEGDGKAKANEAAPAEIEVKLPEGVAADDVLLGEFKTIAKELGLDSAKAQKIVDLQAKQASRMNQEAKQHWEKQDKAWVDSLKNHKDFGGKDLEKNIAIARKAVERFGGEDLRKALVKYGLDNMPELVLAFHKAGMAIKEDSVVGRLGNGASAPSASDQIRARYPNTPQFHK